jgi:hypothetical protein
MSAAGARERRLDLLHPLISGQRQLNLLTVAIPGLVAALLAALELTSRSLWLDEAATVAIVAQHGAALWHAIAHDGGNMVGYYLLMHVLTGVFGDGAGVLRAPSVIATSATAMLVALLALRSFDRRVALSAGLLAAVSLPLIFWGQNARGYALMVAFATASFISLEAIVTTPEGAATPRASVALYILSAALAIYMGLIAALILAAQLAVLPFARRRARRHALLAIAAIALLCLPLALMALHRGSGQLFWVPPLDGRVLGQAARTLTSAGMPPNFHRTASGTATLILTGALLIAAVVAIALSVRRRMPYGERMAALLIAAWLVVPILFALAAAKAGVQVELARGSALVAPAVALLLAWLLHHPHPQPRLPAALAWSGVALLLALRALQLAPSYGVSPEPWRAVADYVRTSASPSAQCLAFYPQDDRMPFDYYLARGHAPGAARLTPVLPSLAWSTVSPFVERYSSPSRPRLAAIARGCPQLWLIASHEGLRRGPPQSRANYRHYRALLGALALWYPRQRARSFGWAATIRVVRFDR